MTTDTERQEYLNESVRKRGYVLESHKLLAQHDLELLKAMNVAWDEAYGRERLLDKKTKEMLLLVSQTALRFPKRVIQNHIKLALDFGADPQEILEALELLLIEAGIPTMFHGIEAWAEVVGAEKFEPTVETYQGGKVAVSAG